MATKYVILQLEGIISRVFPSKIYGVKIFLEKNGNGTYLVAKKYSAERCDMGREIRYPLDEKEMYFCHKGLNYEILVISWINWILNQLLNIGVTLDSIDLDNSLLIKKDKITREDILNAVEKRYLSQIEKFFETFPENLRPISRKPLAVKSQWSKERTQNLIKKIRKTEL